MQGCTTRPSQQCSHCPLLQVFEEGGGAYTKAGTWTIHENEAAMIEAEADADEAWEEALREKAEWTLKPTPSPITTPSKGARGQVAWSPTLFMQSTGQPLPRRWIGMMLRQGSNESCRSCAGTSLGTLQQIHLQPTLVQLSTCRIGGHVPVSVVRINAPAALLHCVDLLLKL